MAPAARPNLQVRSPADARLPLRAGPPFPSSPNVTRPSAALPHGRLYVDDRVRPNHDGARALCPAKAVRSPDRQEMAGGVAAKGPGV
jgi:hypothetical protein